MTWLAFTGWLRPPVIMLLISFAISVPFLLQTLKYKPSKIILSGEDWLLIGMIGFVIAAFFQGSMTSKSFNHTLSFAFVFLVYCIFFKYALLRYGVSVRTIFKITTVASILANCIVIVEWVLLNVFDTIIRLFFIFDDVTSNMVYYPFLFFKSVAGTCEEPSLMALNMNIIFPIGLYFVYTEYRYWLWSYILLYVVALFFTASAGGVGFIIIAYIVSGLLEASTRSILRLIGSIIAVCLISYCIYLFLPPDLQYVFDKFTKVITSKITLDAESANMRTTAWSHAVSDWLEAPWFGKGLAYGSEAYFGFGYQNAYLKILAETGVFSLILFLAFLSVIFLRIMKLRSPLRRFLMIGFLAGVPHLFIADAYYHVCLWILITLVQFIHYQDKKKGVEA